MNDVALVAHQLRYEQKSYWRNPMSAFFTVAFPLLFLVIFGSLNRDVRIDYLGNVKFNQYFVAGIIAYGVMAASFSNLAISITNRREEGILKRIRATPLPSWAYISGWIGNSAVIAGILTVVTTVLSVVFFGVTFEGRVLALIAAVALGVLCFAALGTLVSSLVPNADAAPPIVNIVFFALLFVSGVFFPISPDSSLAHAANYLPTYHFVQAVWATFDPRRSDLGFAWHHLLVLAVWGVAATFLAVRRFRWESRRG